jgi:hypothetical protein
MVYGCPTTTPLTALQRSPLGGVFHFRDTSLQSERKERRAETRSAHKAVVIMAYGEGEQLGFENAELIDCSPHGVGILFHRPLVVGHHFLLKVKLDRTMLVRYAVRNCRTSGRKLFRIGGEVVGFVGPSPEPGTDAVFKALLAA